MLLRSLTSVAQPRYRPLNNLLTRLPPTPIVLHYSQLRKMSSSAPADTAAQQPTAAAGAEPNLHLDKETGEMVSKRLVRPIS